MINKMRNNNTKMKNKLIITPQNLIVEEKILKEIFKKKSRYRINHKILISKNLFIKIKKRKNRT